VHFKPGQQVVPFAVPHTPPICEHVGGGGGGFQSTKCHPCSKSL